MYFPDEPWADDDFWQSFNDADSWEAYEANRPTPWYRKLAGVFAALVVAGMVATGALLPWGEVVGGIGDLREPNEIAAFANEFTAASPYGWLVEEVRVRDIFAAEVGGFVTNNPPDGIITVDSRPWGEDDLRSLMAHEIGHLLDFAVWGPAVERRGGLESEAWAECAAVDSGFERPHSAPRGSPYHCTDDELAVYLAVVADLGPVCKSWGSGECRSVQVISAD